MKNAVSPLAPDKDNPNQVFVIGDGFGFFVFFEKFEDTHFQNGVIKRPESKPRGPRKKADLDSCSTIEIRSDFEVHAFILILN